MKIWPLDDFSADLDGCETNRQTVCLFVSPPPRLKLNLNKTASFQKEAMRTQVALYFFYEVKFV